MRMLFLFFLMTTLQINAQQPAIDSMLTIVKKQNPQEQASTYAELSWHFSNSNIDSALYYGRKVIKVSRKAGFEQGVASGYNSLATALEASGALDSAIVYHEKSLKIKRKIKDELGTADTYNNLGIIADKAGNFEKALKYYYKAIKIYEKAPNASWDKIPMVYCNIGIVYKKQKEYKRTLEYYEKALAMYEQNDHEIGATITRGNIGSLMLRLEDYENAMEYATEASESYGKLGFTRYIPYMLVNRAVVL